MAGAAADRARDRCMPRLGRSSCEFVLCGVALGQEAGWIQERRAACLTRRAAARWLRGLLHRVIALCGQGLEVTRDCSGAGKRAGGAITASQLETRTQLWWEHFGAACVSWVWGLEGKDSFASLTVP